MSNQIVAEIKMCYDIGCLSRNLKVLNKKSTVKKKLYIKIKPGIIWKKWEENFK